MKYFTTKTLAKACNVSVRTVENWRRRDQGPEYEKCKNGRIYYPYETAMPYIKEYTLPDDIRQENEVRSNA